MREDMIGCDVIEKTTGERLGRLVAWSTYGTEDGDFEPCAVVCADGGTLVKWSLMWIRLAMPSPAEAHSYKIHAQMEALRRERNRLAEELRILEEEHTVFLQEDKEACRLVGKGEDETLPQAILRVLAEAREDARRG